MEKQYSGSCNDAIITAYVPVYSAAFAIFATDSFG